MLSVHTQLQLANFIKAIADLETCVEVTRQVLAEKKGFEPHAAFQHLDINQRHYLSVNDLLSFLNELDVYPSEEEVRNLITFNKSSKDLKLTYNDFENMILPATNSNLYQLALARRVNNNKGLSYTSAWALARVLDKEISGMRKIEELRMGLLKARDWDVKEAFEFVDFKRNGFLTAFSVLEFLKSRQIIASYDDALSFMRRADRDQDGKVSFREFAQLLEPTFQTEFTGKSNSPPRKKPTYTYIASPKSNPSSSSPTKNIPSKSPIRTSHPDFWKKDIFKQGYFAPKAILTEKDYRDYVEKYLVKKEQNLQMIPIKNDPRRSKEPQVIHARAGSFSREASRNLSLSQKPIFGPPLTQFQRESQRGGSPSRRSSRDSPRRTQRQDSPRRSEDQYSPRRSEDRYSPRRSQDRYSEVKESYYVDKDNGTFSNYYEKEVQHYDFPGVQHTISQVVPENRRSQISRRLQFERPEEKAVKEPLSPKKKSEDGESEYDYTGYRATLGRSPPKYSEAASHKNTEERPIEAMPSTSRWQDIAATPRKEASLEEISTRKRSPADHVLSPRRQRSPGRLSSARVLSGKSPIKGHEEDYLTRALKEVITYERELQKLKSELVVRRDFSLVASFRKYINEAGQNTTNCERFVNQFRKFGVFWTQTEAAAVFARFDNDGDGLISLKDYEHFIVPSNKEHAIIFRENDSTIEIGDLTHSLFVSFIRRFTQVESQMEDLRTRISKRFSLEDAFRAIDIKEQGYIDIEELREILTYHGFFPTEKDLNNIINKIDADNDGKLSLREFTRGCSPAKNAKGMEFESKSGEKTQIKIIERASESKPIEEEEKSPGPRLQPQSPSKDQQLKERKSLSPSKKEEVTVLNKEDAKSEIEDQKELIAEIDEAEIPDTDEESVKFTAN